MMLVDDRRSRPLQQRDALAQRRLEGDLAVHRARGDRRDLALMPTSSASSSMHSWSIMVESMSASSSFLRRPSASWTTTSIGSDASSARECCAASPARWRRPAARDRRRWPSASQTVSLAPTDRAALCARPAERARPCGLEIERGDKRHGKGRHGKGRIAFGRRDHQGRDPDSRADRERQVGDGARHRRARGRHHRQRRFHAGLFAARPCSPRGRLRPTASACRISSTAMSIPRSPIPPARGCATCRALSAKGGLPGARADLRRRHRPLFPGAGRRHFARCPTSRTRCASAGAAGSTKAGRRNCTASCSATTPRQH